MTGEKLSVGAPYFDATAGPLALALVVVMAAGPLLRWRRDELKALVTRLAIPGAAAIVAIVIVFLLLPIAGVLPRLGLIFAAAVAVAAVAPLAGRKLTNDARALRSCSSDG